MPNIEKYHIGNLGNNDQKVGGTGEVAPSPTVPSDSFASVINLEQTNYNKTLHPVEQKSWIVKTISQGKFRGFNTKSFDNFADANEFYNKQLDSGFIATRPRMIEGGN